MPKNSIQQNNMTQVVSYKYIFGSIYYSQIAIFGAYNFQQEITNYNENMISLKQCFQTKIRGPKKDISISENTDFNIKQSCSSVT